MTLSTAVIGAGSSAGAFRTIFTTPSFLTGTLTFDANAMVVAAILVAAARLQRCSGHHILFKNRKQFLLGHLLRAILSFETSDTQTFAVSAYTIKQTVNGALHLLRTVFSSEISLAITFATATSTVPGADEIIII
jgi:hypothetical protein